MEVRRAAIIILLVLILAIQVLLRLPFLHMPLERDEGAYGYIAQRVLAGELPYRDAFDHKPPVVYYLYAGLIKAFGNTIEAIRIPTLLYSLLTTLALFYLGFLLFGSNGGLLAALLYAIFSGGPLIQGNTSNTETFMVLPLILALALFLKREMFWAGVLSGLAVMIKPVAALNLAVLILFLFNINDRRLNFEPKSLLNLLAGSLVVPLGFLLYFLARGIAGDFIYQAFLVNLMYFRSPVLGLFGRIIHGAYSTYTIAKDENLLLWLFSCFGIAYIFVKYRSQAYLLLTAWTLASLLGVAASGLFFGHYYIQAMPGLSLLAAFALQQILAKRNLLRLLAVGGLVSLCLWLAWPFQAPFYLLNDPETSSLRQYKKETHVVSYRLARALQPQLKPTDRIFVWSAYPEIYFYLNKKSPTIYFNYLGWMETPERQRQIVAEVQAARPEYIVWSGYAFPYQGILVLIEQNYRPWLKAGKWTVFKRWPK